MGADLTNWKDALNHLKHLLIIVVSKPGSRAPFTSTYLVKYRLRFQPSLSSPPPARRGIPSYNLRRRRHSSNTIAPPRRRSAPLHHCHRHFRQHVQILNHVKCKGRGTAESQRCKRTGKNKKGNKKSYDCQGLGLD
uniref:Uncharacterized protein n=1 Tax=Physcomitrium patens TaxID=3218 RepID=A0A2K1IP85_PHYPA|nr:hypothetical protein PHYPA_027407 [Physcomitrium patens]